MLAAAIRLIETENGTSGESFFARIERVLSGETMVSTRSRSSIGTYPTYTSRFEAAGGVTPRAATFALH